MFRTQHTAADVENFPIQLFRFGIVSLMVETKRQVADICQCVLIFRPEDPAEYAEADLTDTAATEPTPEQTALIAQVRRMMLIAGLTSALAVAVVLIAIGYRLYRSEGSPVSASDVTAALPKGARIVATGVAGDRLVVTLDIGGATEIRTFDTKTLKPAGRLTFVSEP